MRLCWALALSLAIASPAQAGVLLEATMNGVPLRLEMGLDRSRVLATVGQTIHLVDLERAHVYSTQDGTTRRARAAELDDGATILPYALTDWSEGPPVAGHGSRYNVLQLGETICGEVLASGWMAEFMGEIGRSIELIQRVDRRLAPINRGTCGSIPFQTFTSNGWPLLAGWQDETVFRAETLRFDYRAEADRFALPSQFLE